VRERGKGGDSLTNRWLVHSPVLVAMIIPLETLDVDLK
jgi:hypothetical protein